MTAARAAVARELTEALDLPRATEGIVSTVRRLFSVQLAALYEQDPASGDLVCRAASTDPASPLGGDWGGRILARGQGMVGLAIAEGRAIATLDVFAETRVALPDWLAERLRAGHAGAVAAVPLGAPQQGALSLVDRTGRRFSQAELELLAAFADHATAVLRNARLYAQSEARRRAAEALAEFGAAHGMLDLEETLKLIVDRTCDLLVVDRAAVALLEQDEPHPVIRFVAARGMSATFQERMRPVHWRDGVVPRSVREQRPVSSADVLVDPTLELAPPTRAAIEAEGYRAALSAPLILQDRALGALVVYRNAPGAFSSGAVELLTAFAAHAALAIERARLYEDLENARREAEIIGDLGRHIGATLELDRVLQRIAEAAQELCHADIVRLFVRDPASRAIVLQHTIGLRTMVAGLRVEAGRGMVGIVAQTGHPFRTADYREDPRLRTARLHLAEVEGVVAAMCVPIGLEGQLEGLLDVANRGPRPFTDRNEAILLRLAAHAAVALRNARLYEERGRAYDELARTQQQLVQAQKMEAVGRLAGGIAHDFNNLLTVILGRSEMLRRSFHDHPQAQDIVLIQSVAQRAATLTRQLLAFSRKQVLEPKVLDLNLLLSAMEPMLRRLIGEDIDTVVVSDPTLGHVRADPGQLEQALMNLAINARDAMPHGGRLTIETRNVELDDAYVGRHPYAQPGRYVVLAVSDTGVGMDAPTRARVFEPFFTTKTPGKGTGLGLATVYGIVKQSGGSVEVYSEPGHGATFRIYLPRVEADVEAPGERAPAKLLPGGAETVLLVEDDADLRELAAEILSALGYRMLTAADPGEALRIAEAHAGRIALLLTDIVMPQMSGRALAERLATQRPDMRVLYMSGYTDNAIVHQGVLEPGIAFLQKPFTPLALAHKVRGVLG